MKSLILFLALFLTLSSCTNHTELGPCVGINEDQNKDFVYRVSGWNAAMGIIFVEFIFPPVFVLRDELYCPVATKK